MKKLLLICVYMLASGSLQAQVWTSLEINPNAGSDPSFFVEYDGKVYFSATDGVHGLELWVTDGTQAGTQMVKDIHTGSGDAAPENMTVYNGKLFFYASTAPEGGELWTSDGTAAGTALFMDINSGTASSDPANFNVANGSLYFTASDAAGGAELWKTNGTVAGTARVADIFSGSGSSYPHGFRVYTNKLYFVAETVVNNQEVWMTDGTGAGTRILKDIVPGATGSFPDELTVFNNLLYFSAKDSVYGREIFTSDGTTAGTALLRDFIPGVWGIYPTYFYVWQNKLWFNAYVQTHLVDDELWSSDGTGAGSQEFKDLNPGASHSSTPQFFFGSGNRMFFSAEQFPIGREPWVTDGTAAGTVLLKDLNLFPDTLQNSSDPTYYFDYHGKVYFTASETTGKRKMYQTDGTPAGTYPLELVAGSNLSARASDFHLVSGGALYLSIDLAGSSGRQLWKYEDTTVTAVGPALEKPLAGVRVYPNPSNRDVSIDVAGHATLNAEIRLLSPTGAVALRERRLLHAGSNALHYPPLPAGIYYLRVEAEQGTYGTKVEIQ